MYVLLYEELELLSVKALWLVAGALIAGLRGSGFHGRLRSHRRLCQSPWDGSELEVSLGRPTIVDPLLPGRGLPLCRPRLSMLLFYFMTCISLGWKLAARNHVSGSDRLDESVNLAFMTDPAGSKLGDKVVL